MNSRTTFFWLVIAVALAAGIFFWQRHEKLLVPVAPEILPQFQIAQVNQLEIFPNGAPEIDADFTNGVWKLTKPISYPAQSTAIENLLGALKKLTPAIKISAAELRQNKNAENEFGFANPQFSIDVTTGERVWHLQIGNKTAPGDQVFVHLVGTDGAFVTDSDWLKFIPRNVNDWRDTSLIPIGENNFNSIVITNGALTMEFQRDPTNRLWRMTSPLPARADSARLAAAIEELRTAQVSQFISDDPKADLANYGLQPPDLDLRFGTNSPLVIHVGKNSSTDTNQLYVKRDGSGAIVTVAKDSFAAWRGTISDFRDSHLLELTVPVGEIQVSGADAFTLQRQNSTNWNLVGETFPVDSAAVQSFLQTLNDLRVSKFVKDFGTATDLQNFGLTTNSRQITIRGLADAGSNILAQLIFGSVNTNEDLIYVKRADENFIYGLAINDFNQLPEHGWNFRERRIWNFSETNVAQITLQQSGKTRVLVRTGANKWSLTVGNGFITPAAIEETAHRLGQLSAYAWVGRNVTDAEKFGLATNNLQITVELKNGQKFSTQFGFELRAAQTAIAATTLDGERWAYIFSPVLYQFVLSYLTIPANVP